MDEVLEFCKRVLLDYTLAAQAAAEVEAAGPSDRLARLAAAGRACRERADQVPPFVMPATDDPASERDAHSRVEIDTLLGDYPQKPQKPQGGKKKR